MTYEFDLISELGELGFVDHGFERAAYLLREFQPATRVRLIGSPPSRMGVRAQGEPSEVAPGILAEVEMLAERFQIASDCLLYTSPSPRDRQKSRMPSSA